MSIITLYFVFWKSLLNTLERAFVQTQVKNNLGIFTEERTFNQ